MTEEIHACTKKQTVISNGFEKETLVKPLFELFPQ